jgi:6-phosphofructokinase
MRSFTRKVMESQMARAKNVVVAQSGGPTAVINCSLRGVIDACQAMPDNSGAIYGGYHGIEGVLQNAGSSPSDPVLVLQAMGRETGYIAAAARLADPAREMPLHIYLPESGLTLADLADSVRPFPLARIAQNRRDVTDDFVRYARPLIGDE